MKYRLELFDTFYNVYGLKSKPRIVKWYELVKVFKIPECGDIYREYEIVQVIKKKTVTIGIYLLKK